MSYLSLVEASSLLNVSKETLRNWDKAGKLRPVRNPQNNYRMYRIEDVHAVMANLNHHEQTALFPVVEAPGTSPTALPVSFDSPADLRKGLSKLHRALRDTEGNSSIIERFDEISKLLFLKLHSERTVGAKNLFLTDKNESTPDYASRIRAAFELIASKNKTLFPEKFRTLKLGNAALTATGNVLAGISLSRGDVDAKGYAYEEMIRNTFDKGDNQQFFTPSPIVDFMVGLVSDLVTGIVCDPACGTGGFLVSLAKQNLECGELLGLEIDERLAWVAGLNLLVHDATNFQINALNDGGSLGFLGKKYINKIDVILTNPPFGSDFTDREVLDTYALGKGKNSRRRGVLFIERCLQLLRPGGVLSIVIDDGVLSLPSAADVRELILNQAEVMAVISLPESAFLPYANVSTSILLLRRKKAGEASCTTTFYARADNVGRKANGEPDVIYSGTGTAKLNNELPEILEAWRAFEKGGCLSKQTENIFVASLSALQSDLNQRDNRIDFQYHHPSRVAAQLAISHASFPLARLADIASVRNENFVPSVDLLDQVIPYTGLANIEPFSGVYMQVQAPANSLSSGVKKYHKGDILFAKMRPNLRKVALIETSDPGYASGECIVLTPCVKDDKFVVDPFLLAILLRSDFVYGQIIHLIAGIGRPRITLKDLLNVRIPIPPSAHQQVLIDSFLASRNQIERLRREAKQLERTATKMDTDSIEAVAKGFVRLDVE